jgi:hypothetical protein
MKFNCGRTPEEKRRRAIAQYNIEIARLRNWHEYFTLLPKRIASGDCRWLEWVERKGTWNGGYRDETGFWSWDYRVKS